MVDPSGEPSVDDFTTDNPFFMKLFIVWIGWVTNTFTLYNEQGERRRSCVDSLVHTD